MSDSTVSDPDSALPSDPLSPPPKKRKAPLMHRVLLFVSSGILTILLLWFWTFALGDIGSGVLPDFEQIEKQEIKAELLEKRKSLETQTGDVDVKIANLEQSQELLRDSTSSTRDTMNQLLTNQKQLAEKNITLSAAEQEAIAQSQKLFLDNQNKYQALNQELVQQTSEKRRLEQETRNLQKELEPLQQRAYDRFEQEVSRAEIKAAILQLALLLPMFAFALWLLAKKRQTTYALLVYPLAISLFLKVIWVVHNYFPSRYFKYIALLGLIAAVITLMVYLIRMISRPRRNLVLKQYREAYDKLQCPECNYPMNRGWFRAAGITRKRASRIVAIPAPFSGAAGSPLMKQEPYACPACGEQLFEECAKCHNVRHSLLPFCESCGGEKALPV